MRKNLDDNFTYELGLNLVIFELKSPSISHDKACLTVFDKQSHIIKDSFSIIISEKKSSNMFSSAGILLSYILFLNTGTRKYLMKT